jgi:LysM repeat protein
MIRNPAARVVPILLALLWVATVEAGERIHEVRPGESASAIAKRYYGDYELAPLLLEYNGKTGNVIRVGEKLRVPFCEVHRVAAGDTWSALAERYLGKATAYRAVAALNGLEPGRPLSLGTEIVFPVALEYRLRRGDTLAGVAERFYGDVELRDALRSYNGIEDPRRLSVGQSLEIPVLAFRLHEPPVETVPAPRAPEPDPDPELVREPESRADPVARFGESLDAAWNVFVEGDYDAARDHLDSLREQVIDEGTPEDRMRFWTLLAFVQVAFDDEDGACTAYRSLAELSTPDFDPDSVSPKIRNVLSRCKKPGAPPGS